MRRKIIFFLIIVLVVIQFVPVKLNQSDIADQGDFILNENPPKELAVIIKSSCYDCHSNYTRYPWYNNIAPVSWWLKSHIDEGKDELNFSEWTSYSEKRKKHKLKEFVEMIEEREMPLNSYLWTHSDAELSDEQIVQLKDWIATIKK